MKEFKVLPIMIWDEFLKQLCVECELNREQPETFLVRFADENAKKDEQEIAAILKTSIETYKKRIGGVYKKLAKRYPQIKNIHHKFEPLHSLLKKEYKQLVDQDTEASATNEIAPPDWHKICREMLESQKRSIRRQATEIVSEPFYVQLGLVERKHQPRRSGDLSFSPEQGSGFFQLDKEEIIETYEHDEFLEQVIKQGQSKKSQGKRIAIIGEPGAGKTTLLEAIGFSPKTPGFPIWISLGSLGEKSLEEYLRQKWLKDALKTSDVTQQQKELEELFKSGEVLLLLDGVDEMPAPSPVQALAKIREELTGWVADARVVLTCRVNVWDASVNALQGFDTYRTLEFSYGDGNKPDQVKQFICEWFFKAGKPELGEPLREKLDEDRHQRIRDLVKNPLRLSLLCQSWYFRQGDLPETKAALYEQFTRAFYDWKEEEFSITPTKRKELNAALGLLAREAIDKEKSRFGIRESFAIDVIGEDLFNLACKLHWLVDVYKDADTWNKVYAFFHPTFQEYFAGCAIPEEESWQYFMNPLKGNYRILEPQWKEVILLWLGREDVLPEKKKKFIQALVEFKDRCGKFYEYRAYFLAAAGIAEYKDFSRSDEIVEEVAQLSLKWNNAYFNVEEQVQIFMGLIAKQARETLRETDCQRATIALNKLLDKARDEFERCEVASILLECNPSNSGAATILTELLDTVGTIGTVAASALLKINPENSKAKKLLPSEAMSAHLKNIAKNARAVIFNPLPDDVNELIKMIQTSHDLNSRTLAVLKLKEILRADVFSIAVKALKNYVQEPSLENNDNFELHQFKKNCYEVIWHCAQNMTYPDFYYAWHGYFPRFPALKKQFVDESLSQIQPTHKTYPLTIDTQSLKLETNTSAIAQKLCTKIYRKAGYSEIPTASDAAQLQQHIPRIQEKLQKPNLALVLEGSEPTEHLLNFCYSLADEDIGLYIGLITSKPLEQPLKGFLPNQPNLPSAIQSWIDEIG